ncbi:hypothetical protein TWF694_009338 [Orbilia ellipsospora]|uniref:Uncharacterized protein n=1 Tax=Orbilia ellipsospora TaxID=2528407 RepID=A0AAV9XI00_9PEZI
MRTMRILRGLLATILLAYSVAGNPRRTTLKIGEQLIKAQSANQDASETQVASPVVLHGANKSASTDSSEGDVFLLTVSTVDGTSPVPLETTIPGSVSTEVVPSVVVEVASTTMAVASTTTAVAVAVATVGVTATETVEVGPGSDADDDETDVAAETAIGTSEPVPIDASATNTVTFGKPDILNSSIVAILGANDTTPVNLTALDSSIVAILGGDDTDDDDQQPTGALPLVGNSSLPIVTGRKLGKRQTVTEEMPNSDSITFQAHAGEGLAQPKIVPLFQQVAATTTTDTAATSFSTTTTDISATLTSGISTTTTTTWTSETALTTSTTTAASSSSSSISSGVVLVTTWSTVSTTTCIPPETHTTVPPVPATCSGTSTLCTVTAAYVISMNPTSTAFWTTLFDTTVVPVAEAITTTQTVYSEDPNGFHVYITTLDNSIGAPTATYFYTTPKPTVIASPITGAAPMIPESLVLYTGIAIFWGFLLVLII